MKQPMTRDEREQLDDLVAGVRQARDDALAPVLCPICGRWRLRTGEVREGAHVSSCPVAHLPVMGHKTP